MNYAELFKNYLEILKKLRGKNYTLYLMHILVIQLIKNLNLENLYLNILSVIP